MKFLRLSALVLIAAALSPVSLGAFDPPHDGSRNMTCTTCHRMKNAPGASLTTVAGNANMCRSCHLAGGFASAKPMNTSDQALPGPGLPSGTPASGNSHRWDAGPAGYLRFVGGAAIASTGSIQPLGAYIGAYAKTYTLTITSGGAVGVATFSWTATSPGGGSGVNLVTGANVSLDGGVALKFVGILGTSFQVNDQWLLTVRPGLRTPLDVELYGRMSDGQVVCSTCHDQHSQDDPPFDPAARAGGLRHFQRLPNDSGQLCSDCHASRNVTTATAGSHPVGVAIPAGAYKSPTTLPLDGTLNRVQCQTCHQVHNGPTSDGTLLRTTNVTALCSDCHTLADPATARHLNPSIGVMWPGGQYGSTFPAKSDPAQRGSCAQCHQPHGWPDSANTATTYPKLLVENSENLCATCHDADGPSTKNIQAESVKASKHPLTLAPGAHSATEPAVVQTRHVSCEDCHNAHRAQVRASLPGPSTSPRLAAGPLTGARGVNLDNAEVNPAVYEYQVCLRCHGDSPNKPAPSTPRKFAQNNLRIQFGETSASFHPVASVGRSANVPSLINGWSKTSLMGCTSCHNNNAGPANGGTGPNGPHGSAKAKLLERDYISTTQTPFSESKYALCFKCHSWDVVRSSQSFKEHDKHVRGGNFSCNICHDPHGSAGYGRLINFDTREVTPFNGKLEWVQNGTNSGTCTLMCHGEPHDRYDY